MITRVTITYLDGQILASGGTVHTTLCNRMSDNVDNSNDTDVEVEVTCKLCLSRMKNGWHMRMAGRVMP